MARPTCTLHAECPCFVQRFLRPQWRYLQSTGLHGVTDAVSYCVNQNCHSPLRHVLVGLELVGLWLGGGSGGGLVLAVAHLQPWAHGHRT